jgi:hypothetical protein
VDDLAETFGEVFSVGASVGVEDEAGVDAQEEADEHELEQGEPHA